MVINYNCRLGMLSKGYNNKIIATTTNLINRINSSNKSNSQNNNHHHNNNKYRISYHNNKRKRKINLYNNKIMLYLFYRKRNQKIILKKINQKNIIIIVHQQLNTYINLFYKQNTPHLHNNYHMLILTPTITITHNPPHLPVQN